MTKEELQELKNKISNTLNHESIKILAKSLFKRKVQPHQYCKNITFSL